MHRGFQRGKLKEPEHLRRSRLAWEDNLIMDFQERGSEGVHWVHLAQDDNQWRTVVYRDVFCRVS